MTAYGGNANALAAGETIHDTFTISIRMANGTLSYATVTVDIIGTNDGPTISAAVTSGAAIEDMSVESGNISDNRHRSPSTMPTQAILMELASSTTDGVLNGTLTATVTDSAAGAGNGTVTWTYMVENGTDGVASAVQSLGAGETASETFTVTIDDGHGGTVEPARHHHHHRHQ